MQFLGHIFLILFLMHLTAFAKPPQEIHGEEKTAYFDEYLYFPKLATENDKPVTQSSAIRALNSQDLDVVSSKNGILLTRPQKKSPNASSLQVKPLKKLNKQDRKCPVEIEGYFCEPNFVVKADVEPIDRLYNEMHLWGLNGKNGVNADKAWNYTTGSSDVVVAVLDTGVNLEHPDLAPNIFTNPFEIPGNNVDDDRNGYIDDTHGYNAISGVGLPVDKNGHGSHVAGTACAFGNGGGAHVGVSWNCKILPIKFLGSGGGGTLYHAVQGIMYALAIKKQFNIDRMILNNSWGGGPHSKLLERVINDSRIDGTLFVAASGNDGKNNDLTPHYPSNYTIENVISVGAIGPSGYVADFSNIGPTTVHVMAPGVDIVSTSHTGDGYLTLSGTSMATPHVSGVAALLWSLRPELSASDIINSILETGNKTEKLKNASITEKQANALRALTNDRSTMEPPKAPSCMYERYSECYSQCKSTYWDNTRQKKLCDYECRDLNYCRFPFWEWLKRAFGF